jgi:Tfp pilus assembly protein PilN
MNAVNLIPLERRRGETPSLPGVPFLGLVAALVVALAGTFFYVGARNQVSTKQSELARVQAGTAEWSAAAAKYAPAIATLKGRSLRFAQLGGLLGQRASWSLLLGQLAGVMPAHAELASMSAAADASASSATSGSTAATPGITISGCAVSQGVVADTMVALRRLSGVSAVSLSDSTLQGSGGSAASASSGAGTPGSCKLPVAFSLTLQFTAPTDLVRLLEGPQAAGAGNPTTSTTAQAAASTSDSTGAAQ